MIIYFDPNGNWSLEPLESPYTSSFETIGTISDKEHKYYLNIFYTPGFWERKKHSAQYNNGYWSAILSRYRLDGSTLIVCYSINPGYELNELFDI